MPAILPPISIDSTALLARYFMPHQLNWIEAEGPLHAQRRPAFALAEKSVRIGWTYADAFKNVRKRLRFKKRDYLFATKDYPSALEYMQLCYRFAGLFDFTRAVLSHGEDYLQVPRLDPYGRLTGFTEEIKIGLIKFDNGSRIIAFSSSPRAMAVHAGDVGLDEFAKHPNAHLLWETAQGRVTWGFDMAVWSSHDGEDTLFNQFAREARALLAPAVPLSHPLENEPTVRAADLYIAPSLHSGSINPLIHQSTNPSPAATPHHSTTPPRHVPASPSSSIHQSINPLIHHCATPSPHSSSFSSASHHHSSTPSLRSPWNLYYRVTIADAIELGLLDVINRVQGTRFTPDQFLADCRARAGSDEVFQQSYMCNPLGAASASIVDWSAIERCRSDYQIERLHLEADDILRRFGEFNPSTRERRRRQITEFLLSCFPSLFSGASLSHPMSHKQRIGVGKPHQSTNPSIHQSSPSLRLGFDVAASGQGDLAVIYLDEVKGDELWLAALFTARTDDWHFLKTVLFHFLENLHRLEAAGDETGLGRQICWEAASHFPGRFQKVNFTSAKHDLGFALMNQLSVAEKRFPRDHQDIAADYFALRKIHTGTRWVFKEGQNTLNPASHCDIAWAGALATFAHSQQDNRAGAAVAHENCWFDGREYRPYSYPRQP